MAVGHDRGRQRAARAQPARGLRGHQAVVGQPVHHGAVRPGPGRRGRRHARRRRGGGPPERHGPHGRPRPASRSSSQLTALEDFEDQGDGPRDARSRARGRRSAARSCSSGRARCVEPGLAAGNEVTVQLGPDTTDTLVTGGFAHEPGGAPAFFFGQLIGYATFDTLADLGFDDSMNELRILVANPDGTRDQARDGGRRGRATGSRRPARRSRSPRSRRPASTRPRTCSTRCS